MSQGRVSWRWMRSARRPTASSSFTPICASTNSSPPVRATIVASGNARLDARGEDRQEPIARLMPECVVHRLEPVEVESVNGDRKAPSLRQRGQSVAQPESVQKAGQRIAPGQRGQLKPQGDAIARRLIDIAHALNAGGGENGKTTATIRCEGVPREAMASVLGRPKLRIAAPAMWGRIDTRAIRPRCSRTTGTRGRGEAPDRAENRSRPKTG